MTLTYEICVDSVEAVAAAEQAGAHRVELCAALFEGGLTPSAGMIATARARSPIRLHVIIRPRGGDFLFSADEKAVMRHDVEAAKAAGSDGVVIGLLDADGGIDVDGAAALIEAARPLAVTFHRAFDVARDPFEALERLVDLGVDRVLTSGQEPSALEGLDCLAELVRRAGDRIVVMPGGGITPRNVGRIVAGSGAREIHFAALAPVESGMRHRNDRVFMGGELRAPEYVRLGTAAADIRRVIDAAAAG